jgi:hypothetical protein
MLARKAPSLSIVILCLSLPAVTGCGRVPEAAVEAARAAVAEAVKAEAPLYAPDAYARAEDSLKSLDGEIAAQAKKSAISRSYKLAAARAAQATAAARQAVTDAAAGREDMRASLGRLAADGERRLADVEARLNQAPASPRLDVKIVQAQLEACRAWLEQARADTAAARIMDARNRLQAVIEVLAGAGKTIESASGPQR